MIASTYSELCRVPSDINEHLPTLFRYASECDHVTECGVRTAVSSYAFGTALASRPNTKLVQVDPTSHPNILAFQTLAKSSGLQTVFHKQSDLVCPIEETDLLFIDTWHVYGHLKRELARWHSYVRKYIILHDTTVDGDGGETVRLGWDATKQSIEHGIPVDEIRRGLMPAIKEFIRDHPEWIVRAQYTNNNGLTILTRDRSSLSDS